MAINWDIQITNVDVANGRADVTATRNDSESALPDQVFTYQYTPIGTSADRTKLLNAIKAEVVARTTYQTSVDAVVTSLELDGKNALEAWELTR